MLRKSLLAIAALSLMVAAALGLRGEYPPALWLAANGALLIVGIVFERWRYQRLAERRPGEGWQATGERFLDPVGGQPVEVMFNPESGERRYIKAGPSYREPPG